MLCCRLRGSADRLGKQHTHGHARRHSRFHERIHVVGTGLGQRPNLPPSSRLCWQVRLAKHCSEVSLTTNSNASLQTCVTASMRSGSGGTERLHQITQRPTPPSGTTVNTTWCLSCPSTGTENTSSPARTLDTTIHTCWMPVSSFDSLWTSL